MSLATKRPFRPAQYRPVKGPQCRQPRPSLRRATSRKIGRPALNRTPSDKPNRARPTLRKSAAKATGDAKPKPDGSQSKKLAGTENGPPGTPVSARDLAKKKMHYDTGYIWTADGNYVEPIKVRIIATDGTMTEVREVLGKDQKESKLQDDTEVVTGENVASESDETTNPFMPRFRSKPK